VLYKRIASADNKDELRDLQVEMIDRFGLLPEQVKVLFAVTELKQQADKIGVKKIDVHAEGGRIIFGAEPKLNMQQLLTLIQTQAQTYKFEGGDKLRFTQNFSTTDEKVAFISALLTQLTDEIA
jgi:transcription-repair coupling factor (superfamily II helicase)